MAMIEEAESMDVQLNEVTQKLLEHRMKEGGFGSANDAIHFALSNMAVDDALDGFAPGELDALIAEAEEDYRKNGGLTHEEVWGPIYAQIAERQRAQ
jgi:hypothetical protein